MTQTRDDATRILGHDARIVRDVVRACVKGEAAASRICGLAKPPAGHAKVHAIVGDMRDAGLPIDGDVLSDPRLKAIHGWRDEPRIDGAQAEALLRGFLAKVGEIAADPSIPVRPERVWLFGSHAKGEARVGDLDVAVEWKARFDWAKEPGRREEAKAWARGLVGVDDRLGGNGSFEDLPRAALRKVYGGDPPRRLSLHRVDELEGMDAPCRSVWTRQGGGRAGPLLDHHPRWDGTSVPPERVAVGDIAHGGPATPMPLDPKGLAVTCDRVADSRPAEDSRSYPDAVRWLGAGETDVGTGPTGRPGERRDVVELRDGTRREGIEVPVTRRIAGADASGRATIDVALGDWAGSRSGRPAMPAHVRGIEDLLVADAERLVARGATGVRFQVGPESRRTDLPREIRDAFVEAAANAARRMSAPEAERSRPESVRAPKRRAPEADDPEERAYRRAELEELRRSRRPEDALAAMTAPGHGRFTRGDVHLVASMVEPGADPESATLRVAVTRRDLIDATSATTDASDFGRSLRAMAGAVRQAPGPDGVKPPQGGKGGFGIEHLLTTFGDGPMRTLRLDRAKLEKLFEAAAWRDPASIGKMIAGAAERREAARRKDVPRTARKAPTRDREASR